ncbi:hypothetical protein BASA62_003737 [Batrachochytrium salamandrivorans]|nr:hypothetical protein BASA62_003737 [Batrachochytrium salamandrivorans]
MAGQSSSDSTSQDPMDDQSSPDPTSQDPMDDQSSSDSASQDPPTEVEEERVESVYDILCREVDELARKVSSINDELDNVKDFIFKHGLYCGVDHGGSCINAGALAADLNSDIVELGEKLKITMEEYQAKLKEQNEFKEAEHLED